MFRAWILMVLFVSNVSAMAAETPSGFQSLYQAHAKAVQLLQGFQQSGILNNPDYERSLGRPCSISIRIDTHGYVGWTAPINSSYTSLQIRIHESRDLSQPETEFYGNSDLTQVSEENRLFLADGLSTVEFSIKRDRLTVRVIREDDDGPYARDPIASDVTCTFARAQ